jgi:hypothetical protein
VSAPAATARLQQQLPNALTIGRLIVIPVYAGLVLACDGGRSWAAAELADPPAPNAWQAWSYTWEPPGPGEYELCCRAADASRREQPTTPRWNLGGYADNDVQRVPVTVPGDADPA